MEPGFRNQDLGGPAPPRKLPVLAAYFTGEMTEAVLRCLEGDAAGATEVTAGRVSAGFFGAMLKPLGLVSGFAGGCGAWKMQASKAAI